MPIRDENLELSPATNFVEVGHEFTLATARTLSTGRYYVNTISPGSDVGQHMGIAIYPAGAEDQSGPIESVIIPCSTASVTGGSVINAATATAALLSPTNGLIFFNAGAQTLCGVRLSFAVGKYPQLNGKRILGLNLLYGLTGTDSLVGPGVSPAVQTTRIVMTTEFSAAPLTDKIFYGILQESDTEIIRVPLGEINPFWTPTSPVTSTDRMHWTWPQLLRLDTTTPWLFITISSGTSVGAVPGENFFLNYAALEILYCEETRVAFGALALQDPNSGLGGKVSIYGANIITLRSMNYTANPVLGAGRYTAVVTSPYIGAADAAASTSVPQAAASNYPLLNAVRELYGLPTHPGVQVNIPFPMDVSAVGKVLSATTIAVLPQLSLHASGGTLTEPHVYGRQGAAQVYGANTATQEIYDDIIGGTASYPQVRWLARRFADTTVPLTLTGTGSLAASTVSISVAEFDALTEIIDGWKEVTLRFAVPPTMGGLATPEPSWTWSSTGETAGNRWEILAACAPAVSGVPGNLYNLVPAADQLYGATYQPPAGAQVELTWMPQGVGSPYVTGAAEDDSCDAFLIFSQDPPTVTGVAITARTQTVTGIGLDCGSLPCCIPTGIAYQRITWGLPPNTGIASDDFNRVEAAGGWGTASDGHVWTLSGTAANFSVDGTEGLILPTALNSSRLAWVDIGGVDQDITVLARINDVAESGNMTIGLVGRVTDASNYLAVEFRYETATTELLLRERIAGTTTTLVSNVPTLLPAASAWRWIRLQIVGTAIRAKVWGLGEPEPGWMISATNTLATGTNAGVIARDNTGAAAPSTFMFDQFAVSPPDYGFGGVELQRFDTVTNVFETIMLASSPAVTGFNDYEARVGVDSVYRLRNLNVYNFAGAWSTQVTGAIPAPGVSGGCDDATGALIFTSNADQSGQSNAAYVMQWESTPVEDFGLPEADQVVFQAMYGRDGVVAFHGTERGLEDFSRVLLIHAAAIDPIRLADVTTLRDLAWADLPYICVRDDIADRWFANVQVPTVNARFNRTKYLARVDIRELTRTPYPVDP